MPIVTVQGRRMDQSTLDAYLAALGGVPSLQQGSYNRGVGASGGTHDGGGVIDTRTLSRPEQAALAKRGVAAQNRTPAQGFAYHNHAVELDNPNLSGAAEWQRDEIIRGNNGLAGRGSYDGPRPIAVRWSKGLRARLATPARRRMPVYRSGLVVGRHDSHNVGALQHRLKITADGVFGPQTKAAVEHAAAVRRLKPFAADGKTVSAELYRALFTKALGYNPVSEK